MRSTYKAVLVATAAITALALGGCTTAPAATTPDGPSEEVTFPHGDVATLSVNEEARALLPAAILERGTLLLASDPTYPPFEYYDTDNTTMIGWDVDMGNALAQVLGLEPEHVAATFDTILPGLTSDKYDVGISSFSVTEERKKQVDFVPYLASGTNIAVAPGNPGKLSVEDPFTLCGKKIATQKGAIQGQDIVPEFSAKCTDAGKEPIDLQQFPSQTDANLALVSGRVDAVMADTIPLSYLSVQSGGSFELGAGGDYQPELLGIALNKGSALVPALTAAMAIVLGDPVYEQINTRWGIPQVAALEPGTK